jgi:hypothetical protein
VPSDPVEAEAYADLISEMRMRDVAVEALELSESLLDLRPAAVAVTG